VLTSWETLYQSDLLGVYALVLVPALFLLVLLRGRPRSPGVEPRAAGFVHAWALVFTLETILDPIATRPALSWLGLEGGRIADVAMVPFVLLGDFRVFLLVLRVAQPARALGPTLGEAAAWTCLVPAVAGTLTAALRASVAGLPSMTIWMVYEAAFLVLALVLRARLVPARVDPARPAVRAYLRAIFTYVATYYALWVAADLAIVVGGLDLGWALRIVPNLLYYVAWVPFAWWRFFSPRYASTRSSTQAAR
jgi:hypothetical protein